MIQDEESLAIKKDRFLLDFGYRLFRKNQLLSSQCPHIGQKLMELGRLDLMAKEIHTVKSIKELIKPEMYSNVVNAAKCLPGLNEES